MFQLPCAESSPPSLVLEGWWRVSRREDLTLRLRENFVADGTAREVVNSLSHGENKWTRRFFETFGALELASVLAVWACLCGQSPLLSPRHRGPTWAGGFLSHMKGIYPVQELDSAACQMWYLQTSNLSEPVSSVVQ